MGPISSLYIDRINGIMFTFRTRCDHPFQFRKEAPCMQKIRRIIVLFCCWIGGGIPVFHFYFYHPLAFKYSSPYLGSKYIFLITRLSYSNWIKRKGPSLKFWSLTRFQICRIGFQRLLWSCKALSKVLQRFLGFRILSLAVISRLQYAGMFILQYISVILLGLVSCR